jgi:hypothetical protein
MIGAWYKGKNNRSRGRREDEDKPLQELCFVTTRFLESCIQKEKEMVRTWEEQGKIGRRQCSALAGNAL